MPTSASWSPRAHTISVVEGNSEIIRSESLAMKSDRATDFGLSRRQSDARHTGDFWTQGYGRVTIHFEGAASTPQERFSQCSSLSLIPWAVRSYSSSLAPH